MFSNVEYVEYVVCFVEILKYVCILNLIKFIIFFLNIV